MTLNPCDPDHLGAYAQFMFKVRGNTERADYLFAKAIEADPTHWHNLSRHANMLKKTGTAVAAVVVFLVVVFLVVVFPVVVFLVVGFLGLEIEN